MQKGRIDKLFEKVKPPYQMPLVIEQTENGYQDNDGNILTAEDIDWLTAERNVQPGLPDCIVIDLSD